MPISGLVIVLDGDDAATQAAVESIRANSYFTLGEDYVTARVAAVLETESNFESREQIDWARRLQGVAMVEVAYVHFADTQPQERICNGP